MHAAGINWSGATLSGFTVKAERICALQIISNNFSIKESTCTAFQLRSLPFPSQRRQFDKLIESALIRLLHLATLCVPP